MKGAKPDHPRTKTVRVELSTSPARKAAWQAAADANYQTLASWVEASCDRYAAERHTARATEQGADRSARFSLRTTEARKKLWEHARGKELSLNAWAEEACDFRALGCAPKKRSKKSR